MKPSLAFLATLVICVLSGFSDAAHAQSAQATPVEPKNLYSKHCSMCHGPDGKAQTPIARKIGVKSLAISKFSTDQIENQIRLGTKDAKGAIKMPSFEEKLSKEEIAQIASYVKTLQH
jgi:mono/diheme cytochrome c family protein